MSKSMQFAEKSTFKSYCEVYILQFLSESFHMTLEAVDDDCLRFELWTIGETFQSAYHIVKI